MKVSSMLTLSYTAGELLDLLLAKADAPDDAVIRMAELMN